MCDRDTADDLTSQTFLRALDRLSTFDPGRAPLPAWILGIARNVVRDHLRARRRWGWLPLDWLRERASTEPTPEQRAIRGARLTGLGESHVGVLVYRAVGKLRARLGGEEADRG